MDVILLITRLTNAAVNGIRLLVLVVFRGEQLIVPCRRYYGAIDLVPVAATRDPAPTSCSILQLAPDRRCTLDDGTGDLQKTHRRCDHALVGEVTRHEGHDARPERIAVVI